MSDFTTGRHRRARKGHTCIECRRDIEPGEQYSRVAGATDGYGWSVALCLACDSLNEAVWDIIRPWNLVPEDGPVFGGIVAWVADADIADRLPDAAREHYEALRKAAQIQGQGAAE